jgi:hypothetical protein
VIHLAIRVPSVVKDKLALKVVPNSCLSVEFIA